ncbi:MAG: sulfatase [Bacteroidetes bacterium GWA2_40_15]|nr:MAG: sulfatase [Bacteroidetes bacterium GWA2_40_15]OFX99533.1 MAG: sulfatase [Bacteroidetes bacterium GWC2_40_22]HAM10972.1 sulfatase [Bacteroidales bacterium]HBH85491.1 sulfatase [Bacteroidales bacterium]
MKRQIVIAPILLWAGIGLSQETKPNIVFILADDLGWKDLVCYGNKSNETPALDALAKSGIRFSQAYAACPVSSPTRASIMTGKYPARLHLTNFIAGNRTDTASRVLPAPWKPYMESKEVTIAELLKEKGYMTGMVGKWHLGGNDSLAPWNQGFDYSRMIGKNGLDFYNYSIYSDSYSNEFTDHGKEYLTDKLTEYGVEFIEKNKKKPFFLYLAYSAPHVGIVPRSDKLMKYFFKYGQSEEKFNPNYAAMIESLDEGVGKVMETLGKLGLLENTLVVFTSDNGGLGMDELGPTPTSMLPLRKWKGHVYEGGIRVPAIVSWPGRIRSGITSDFCYSSVDYLPTICELTGIKNLPDKIDGMSILSVLLNPDMEMLAERPLYWHYPHFSNQMGRPAGAVRFGKYKLVELYESNTLELYDLEEDISESQDLSGQMVGKTDEMHKMLINWRSSVDAQMPLPNTVYKQTEK